MIASDEARVMLRPFRVFADLDLDDRDRPEALAKLGLMLLVLGAFVSFVTAGRLVAFHVASIFLFYSFAIAYQLVALVVVKRALRVDASLWRLARLHALGLGPWMTFLLVVAGVCLFAPDVYAVMMWLIGHGVLPLALLFVMIWSGVCTFAAFRASLELTCARAGLATFVYYATYTAIIVGYYLAMGQIQPQFPGIP